MCFFTQHPLCAAISGIWGFSGKEKAHKLLTHKLFETAVNPGTTSRLTRRNAYLSGFGGEHITFLVWSTGRLSRGQPDPHQSKKFMFMCLPLSLPLDLRKTSPINSWKTVVWISSPNTTYTPRRNDYQNNSIAILLGKCPGAPTRNSCKSPEIFQVEFIYARAPFR